MKRLRRGAVIGFGIAVVAAALVASGSAGSDRGAIHFKGQGVKTLPTFRVAGPSTLYWTNSGSFFQISSRGDYCYDARVTSDEHQGSTYIPAGSYWDLRVRAIGMWTISIHKGLGNLTTPITFSGSGERALPPFHLRTGGTMLWTNTGERFQTIPLTGRDDGVVSSGQHRGKTHLRAGRYRFVVDATEPDGPMGSWRIVIR
jgi:hypothetical protein